MSTILLAPTTTLDVDVFPGPVKCEKSGGPSLDSGRAPYGKATVSISLVDLDVLDDLDAALLAGEDVRGVLSVGDVLASSSRAFDLGIRRRVVDHERRLITCDLATDEAILIAHRNLTPDAAPLSYQSSVRAIVNHILGAVIPGATLEPGTDDATFHVLTDSLNVIANGSFETNTTGWTATSATLNRANDWAASGGWCGRIEPSGVNNSSFIQTGNLIGFGLAEAGKTYRARGTLRLAAVQTGALHASARRVEVFHKKASDPTYTSVLSTAPPNAIGTYDLSVDVALPAGTTECFVRLWNGASTASWARWDAVRMSVVSADPTDTGYYDGATPNTAEYAHSWNGIAYGSTSTRIALQDRDPELLIWGVPDSAWAFLEPITAGAGLRLYCDEQRRWFLVNPATWGAGGMLSAAGWNAPSGTDTIDRDNGDAYCTCVIVLWRWTDATGAQREHVETAGVAGPALEVTLKRPYPGDGLAAAMLARRAGQGREQDVTVAGDWNANPGMEVQITLPGTSTQIGRLASVSWDLADGFMTLGTIGLVDATPDTWLGTDRELDWAEVDPALDWDDATGGVS